jgi:hypothetical protein
MIKNKGKCLHNLTNNGVVVLTHEKRTALLEGVGLRN